MNNICIIPARGGSKRIPGKNIKDFLGKPIIAYSILAAKESGLFSEIMVSTDCDDIANISREYGATVPFMRSDKNSDDFATTADVLREVLLEYMAKGSEFKHACCLYPAAPLVTSEKLIESYEVLNIKKFDSLFPVIEYSSSIYRSFKLDDDRVEMNWPEYADVRTQDLNKSYYDSGQFYWFDTREFILTGDVINNNCGGFPISEIDSQDIDNETDWLLAEMKYNLKVSKKNINEN
ncbi:NeuA protein/acylneuraminate cytidylyltransferase [Oleispira antarctica RB-8]|uniref:NeuA protein/acylneuraminate cytidylyltransferase n=1 Tax=Oleispira antarctica RB-8 TaxID=698738 RepID=R4YLV6_OLEAN|nr:NeuA protein/acylneuraminate cytidylyltransferase [Oleispira antarctica RB-8]